MFQENSAERRPKFSASVGVIPLYESPDGSKGVVLGLRIEDGLWTPIAGGLENQEYDLEALCREWQEETGLNPEESLQLFPIPLTTTSPQPGKTSVGITYIGKYTGPALPLRAWGDEIEVLESFAPERLKNLLDNPEGHLFRPDLNLGNLTAILTLLSPNDGVQTILLNRARQSTQRFIKEDTYF
ncbi:hypothetical protein A2715_03545 [Candidatus Woesebacteria bacterium RIFCSPHIGHO2_01_FULL_39_32]|uniref:Nudix hydrolase domain-containing protein n=1 Tax=Candidatus Woesebacteria bacterium RIFCSPLOWO2_01_FULL_39_25 TaxID=1802521 RepID=A0A1F8BL04_9BACT|nr:MAG: hypothetical protein A2124_04850 [Candidatus Woesebacteria bacterium GWB1_37_5]OGM24814.1 MAG: hypothetical protein A2715_03545 [Candidatus Woesebacteria bacterium RIFCSPHIGHO2_01_FULL_39_32]OGM37135.1 MAG: hypothetical protein A3F01_05485 [Candidatus Woesebacteria bacterium RIFCSPHIGHO2_12_FULL_38_11]OGM64640.1 MAG: hypothetical protein A2893_06460 [Candidatus Woesebacteria bacterium RIFCSPLOWO2_01_FULL_39_25]